jgi:predicted phosphodiesterase
MKLTSKELNIINYVLDISKEHNEGEVCNRDTYRVATKNDVNAYSVYEIEKEFGSYSNMKNKIRSYLNEKEEKQIISNSFATIKSKASAKEFKRQNDQLIEFNGKFNEILKESVKKKFSTKLKSYKTKTIKPKKTDKEAVLLISDWHYGEVVIPNALNFMNVYDVATADERIEQIFKMHSDYLIENQINKTTIVGLGDQISGSIHDELSQSNEIKDTEAVIRVGDIIIKELINLSQIQEKVKFINIVGNHSRLTKEKRFKDKVETSLEYILGHYIKSAIDTLKEHNSNFNNIEVEVPNSFFIVEEVAGLKLLLMHGDISLRGVKGLRTMKNVNTMANELKDFEMDFDVACVGHYHNFNVLSLNKRKLICNASLVGVNEYAAGLGVFSNEISQTLFTVNEGKLEDIKILDLIHG